MAAIRTFLKRKVSQQTTNQNSNNTLTTTNTGADSSSDTSSSTAERLNHQRIDGYSSTSTIGVLTVNSDDSVRRPLLQLRSANRRKKLLLRLVPNTNVSMANNLSELVVDENTSLIDRKLPKELILRFVFDVLSIILFLL